MLTKRQFSFFLFFFLFGVVFLCIKLDLKFFKYNINKLTQNNHLRKQVNVDSIVNNPFNILSKPLDDILFTFGKPNKVNITPIENPYYSNQDIKYELKYLGKILVGIQLSKEAGNHFLISRIEWFSGSEDFPIQLGMHEQEIATMIGSPHRKNSNREWVYSTESNEMHLIFQDQILTRIIWYFYTG